MFPSVWTKDLVFYLRISVFSGISEKYTPIFLLIVCLFPSVMELSQHILICKLEISDNKENCLSDKLLWSKIKLFFSNTFS